MPALCMHASMHVCLFFHRQTQERMCFQLHPLSISSAMPRPTFMCCICVGFQQVCEHASEEAKLQICQVRAQLGLAHAQWLTTCSSGCRWVNMPLGSLRLCGWRRTCQHTHKQPTVVTDTVFCLLVAGSLCLQVLDPITEHLLQLVASNDERLADYGTDRTYNIFRCLVNTNLTRIIQYCVPDEEKLERYAKVTAGLVCVSDGGGTIVVFGALPVPCLAAACNVPSRAISPCLMLQADELSAGLPIWACIPSACMACFTWCVCVSGVEGSCSVEQTWC